MTDILEISDNIQRFTFNLSHHIIYHRDSVFLDFLSNLQIFCILHKTSRFVQWISQSRQKIGRDIIVFEQILMTVSSLSNMLRKQLAWNAQISRSAWQGQKLTSQSPGNLAYHVPQHVFQHNESSQPPHAVLPFVQAQLHFFGAGTAASPFSSLALLPDFFSCSSRASFSGCTGPLAPKGLWSCNHW